MKISTFNIIYLNFIFFLLGILPIITNKFTHTSHLTGLILFTLIILPYIYKYANNLKKIPIKIILFITLIIIYMLIQHIAFSKEWSQKAYMSIFVIFYISTISYLSMLWFKKINSIILLKTFKIFIPILYLIAFFNIFANYPYSSFYQNSRSIVPFGEPSHYALFSGMFFMIYFVITDKWLNRMAIIILTITLAILFPNTTMLTFVLLMILLLIKLNIKYILLFIVTVPIIFYLFTHIPYFSNRTNISDNTNTNLSKLVYLQGIDYTKSSLINTNGLGLGFQMMGSQEPSKLTKKIIRLLGTKNTKGLNREDGGFLAAKIITEFGVLGILLLFGYLNLFFKSLFYLRKNIIIKSKRMENDYKLLIVHAIIFSFFIEIFIRGIGYFTPTTFIFLTALIYYLKYSSSQTKRKKYEYITHNRR